ncbi:putative dehydrogenase [Pontibacter ummariensis]|uniref:Predicted dehydrogenase n=1 Tax=Pontibacter ummariensis TaxID=1610492 RepID=A0A239HRP6_9BACT|nr:Gfo/Idh/MocA family oxidoreductase [Pontibacter ummariensis]PRY10356.1 putative dehydrogenase [Pontibacter ummariensis]SNS82954.1 Predicted dehydrogenase [Pontibacter ummariensis]
MAETENATVGNRRSLKVALAGLSHDHVQGVLQRYQEGKISIVGIAEQDEELVQRYQKQFHLPKSLFYKSLSRLLQIRKPVAVMAFNAIAGHVGVVEKCAPLGIHVMVEKPLATSLQDAEHMAKLARQHNIYLLTNYETTWYPSNQEVLIMVNHKLNIGEVRKMVVHDGNAGPKEIGCSAEFLDWLTDPEMNGGGAIMDFGCYGANLMTCLMQGQRPKAVTAVTRQLKPHVYPDVDDDATILLEYPKATGIIEASWNWPFDIKDLEVYGESGYLQAVNHDFLRKKGAGDETYRVERIESLAEPYEDYTSYFAAVVNGEIKPKGDLSSLENNLIVMEILEAARQSAREERRVVLEEQEKHLAED